MTWARAIDCAAQETIWLDTLRKEPADVKEWLNPAQVLQGLGRYDEVWHAAEAPGNVNQLLNLPWVEGERRKLPGMAAAATKNWPEAAGHSRQSVAPARSAGHHARLAQALPEHWKPGEALKALEEAGPNIAGDPAAGAWRATGLPALGCETEARQAAAPAESLRFPPPPVAEALTGLRKALEGTPAAGGKE